MARIHNGKKKEIQIVENFFGQTHVYQDTVTVKWKDFKKAGIRNVRQKDGTWSRILTFDYTKTDFE